MVALSTLTGGSGGSGGSAVVCNPYGVPLPSYIQSYEYKSTTSTQAGVPHCGCNTNGGGITSISDNTFIATVMTGYCNPCARICSRVFEIDDDGVLTAKTDWCTIHTGDASFNTDTDAIYIFSDNCCNVYFGNIRCSVCARTCIKRFTGSSLSNVTAISHDGPFCNGCPIYSTYAGSPGWVHSYGSGTCYTTKGQIHCNGSLYMCACECAQFGQQCPQPLVVSPNELNFHFYTCPCDCNCRNSFLVTRWRKGSTTCSGDRCGGYVALGFTDMCNLRCLNAAQNQCGLQFDANPHYSINIGRPTVYLYGGTSGDCLAHFNNACCDLNNEIISSRAKVTASGADYRWCWKPYGGQWCGDNCVNNRMVDVCRSIDRGQYESPLQHNFIRSSGFRCISGTQYCGYCLMDQVSRKGGAYVENHLKLDDDLGAAMEFYGHSPQTGVSVNAMAYLGNTIVGKQWRVGLYVRRPLQSCVCAEIIVEKIVTG